MCVTLLCCVIFASSRCCLSNAELPLQHTRILRNTLFAGTPCQTSLSGSLASQPNLNCLNVNNRALSQIDLPAEDSQSEVIAITGRKSDCEEARKMIRAIEKEQVGDALVTFPPAHDPRNRCIDSCFRLRSSVVREVPAAGSNHK